jgi:hypothetical protein
MAEFPRLSTGAVAQYPSSKQVAFATNVTRFIDGSEQRFRTTGSAVKRWVIQLSAATAEEIFAVEGFFASQQGRFGTFSFTDPWDGIEYADCSFDEDAMQTRYLSEWRAGARLIIRNNQV